MAAGKHTQNVPSRRAPAPGVMGRVRAPQWTNLPAIAPESLPSLRVEIDRALHEYSLGHWRDAERVLLQPMRSLQGMLALRDGSGDRTQARLLYASAWTILGRTRVKLDHRRYANAAFEQAASMFDSELRTASEARAEDWAAFGFALEHLHREADALEAFERALELGLSTAEVHRHRGVVLRTTRPETAEQCFRTAYELAPHDPLNMRALAEHIEAQRPGEGLELLEQAAFVYASRGDPAQALELFERTLESRPSDANACAGRSEMLRLLDRCEEALPGYERSLELAPDVPWVMAGHAAALHRLGRNQEALALLKETLIHAPDFAFAVGMEGRVLRALGQLQESAEVLRRVPARDPSAAWILADLGETLRLMNQDEEALDALNRALELLPTDASARATRAAVYMTHGAHTRANRDIDRALQLDPKSAFAHAVRGQILYDTRDFSRAVSAFETATELDPREARYLSMLGDALWMAGRLQGASIAFDRSLELQPDYSAALVRKGALMATSGDKEAGLALVNRALAIEKGQYPHALTVRGRIQNDLGRVDEAEADFRQSLELDPRQPLILAELGEIVRRRGDPYEALALADRALEPAPELVVALLTRAHALRTIGDPTGAAATLQRVVEIDASNAWYHAELGATLLESGDPAGALPVLDRALELEPDHLYALATKGQVLRVLGRLAEAIEVLRQASERSPEEPWILIELGEALRLGRRYLDALVCFDEVLKLDPDNQWAHAGRGSVLRELHRYRHALSALDRSLEIAPEFAFAKGAKAELLVDIGRYTEAIALIDSIDGATTQSWLMQLLGWACELARDGSRAFEAYRVASGLMPESLLCKRGIAEAQLLLSERMLALAGHKEIVEIGAEKLSVESNELSILGWSYLRLGQLDAPEAKQSYELAVRYLGSALSAEDDVLPLQFDMALALLCSAQARAVQSYERGIAAARKSPPLRRRAVLALAIADLDEAVTLVPGISRTHVTRLIEKLRSAIDTCDADIKREAETDADDPTLEHTAPVLPIQG